MRILVVFILFLFLGQQTTVNGQQTSSTGGQQTTVNGQQTSCTSDAYPRTVDCCPLSVDYYESQISKADSLYKNYLPQYNFEEVKAAMEFFDSLRLIKTTDNSQQTTDFFHRWTTDNSQRTTDFFRRSKTKSCTSDACSRTVDCCPLSVDFICAKAHYYHAVGLTEKDDIVGACEHYLIALEIMEPLVETSPLWRLMANDKSLKTKGKALCDSASLRLCDSNKEDYEKIRFVALIYTRLGRLFYNENYCDLALIKYKNALKYYNIINDTMYVSYTYKSLGNVCQLNGKLDSALYCYNESLRYDSSLINKLDVEKNIAQILFDKGDGDSAYLLIKSNFEKIENYNAKDSYSFILGEMYFVDKVYDSAIHYLERSFNSQHYYTRLM